MEWMCLWMHIKQLYSLHKRAIKFLMPSPNKNYNQKCCALKLLPLDKQLLLNKCGLMQKAVHGKAPQYPKDLMIPSERLHVHGNKQLLPRTRIDIVAGELCKLARVTGPEFPHPFSPVGRCLPTTGRCAAVVKQSACPVFVNSSGAV